MKIAIVSSHITSGELDYSEVAKLTTYGNHAEYCKRHGYAQLVKTGDWQWATVHPVTWERLGFLFLKMVQGEFDWYWLLGTDTLITNLAVRLEDIIAKADGTQHVLACAEWCSPIQADSMLFRNAPETVHFLAEILRLYPKYKGHPWVEQQAMIDTRAEHEKILKILPQRVMNAYDYEVYRKPSSQYATYPGEPRVMAGKDLFDNDGQWQKGDFVIHFPGTPRWWRLQNIPKYLEQVVR